MDSQKRSQQKPTIVFKFKNPIEATEEAEEEYSDYAEELEDGTVLIGSYKGDDRGLIKKKKIVAPSGVGGGGSVNGKGRSLVGGVPPTLCQVDNCATDLEGGKRYHQRHKVCEVHAKAAAVVVAGLRQRFCQQCSRFHELSAFDDARRSCRSRLAGHNERRRKSTSEAAQVDVKGSSRRQSSSLGMKEKPRQLGERGIAPAAIHEKQFQLL